MIASEFFAGVLVAVVLLGIGFFAGRRTVVSAYEAKKFSPGKIPLVERDPYQQASGQQEEEVIKDRE